MSKSAVFSRAQLGVSAPLVTVETHLPGGLPGFTMVGLPATAVREARDRVRSAIVSCGFAFPKGRVVVNLAPGDLTKEGPRYDLAIAASILCATGQLPIAKAQQYEYLGELGLDGKLRSVRGTLCASLALRQSDQAHKPRAMIVPVSNARETALLDDPALMALPHLSELRKLLLHPDSYTIDSATDVASTGSTDAAADSQDQRLDDILGQEAAKRALIVAAAGGHHLLLVGPPGTGKTLLARALAALLPPLRKAELIEVATVYSAAGVALNHSRPPVREPHHSTSAAGLIGGGASPRPGEVSMAHHGVLFLDELPHFNSNVLNLLREPMGSRSVTLARARYQLHFPARFQLVAAMNPCPAGRLCSEDACRCAPARVQAYQAKVSGPLIDRIDLQVQVPSVPQDLLLAHSRGECAASPEIARQRQDAHRARIQDARARQFHRQGCLNAELDYQQDRSTMSRDAQRLLAQIARKRPLSARAFHRLLKVARTIADLAAAEAVDADHVGEAFSYRQLDWEHGLGLPGARG